MAETVTMPKLGFDMAEGVLVRWVVSLGGHINRGEVLAEIETDKATVEVESSHSGTILKFLVEEGDIVPVNAPIAVVGEAGEAVEGGDKPAEKPAEKPAPEKAAAPSTESKPEASAPATGTAPTQAEPTPAPAEEPAADIAGLPDGVRASPVARNIAREKGIDLRKVKGTGPHGRIIKKDVEGYTPAPVTAPVTAAPTFAPAPAAVAPTGEDTTILTQQDGRFLFPLKANSDYQLQAHGADLLNQSRNLSTKGLTSSDTLDCLLYTSPWMHPMRSVTISPSTTTCTVVRSSTSPRTSY